MWRALSIFREPYKGFAFLLKENGRAVGGFGEVSGLAGAPGSPQTMSRQASNFSPTPDGAVSMGGNPLSITLKRGLLDSKTLSQWIKDLQDSLNLWRRDMTIEMRDEAGRTVTTYLMHGCWPIKHTGPSQNSKGSDIAIEEWVLGYERYETLV